MMTLARTTLKRMKRPYCWAFDHAWHSKNHFTAYSETRVDRCLRCGFVQSHTRMFLHPEASESRDIILQSQMARLRPDLRSPMPSGDEI